MSLFRRPLSAPSGRAEPLVPRSRSALKRRIVLHVLRAPHGEIAMPVDETAGCGHRRAR
jgi:hypothetical protein